jgi:hypothetical protein
MHGRKEIAEFLLQHGADPNGGDGDAPAQGAISENWVVCVETNDFFFYLL